MSFRIAKSLDRLRDQINAAFPMRDRKSDGWIGDPAHRSRSSDHNPHIRDGNMGIVTALDITHDPANGVHARELAEALINSRDKRIKYVISEGQIASSTVSPWKWRKYSGANGHYHHFHISVNPQKSLYDDDSAWAIDGITAPPPDLETQFIRLGDRGHTVKFIQQRLGIKADGIFGPQTEREVKAFQKQKGLTVDGIVGPKTWVKLLG